MYTANTFLINQTSLAVTDLMLVRTTIQFLLCSILVSSVRLMAVPDSLCIIFAFPVVTIFLSAVLLRDKITLVKVESSHVKQCAVLMMGRSWPSLVIKLTN